MATSTGTGTLTLADHAKRLDPNGKIDAVAELLSENNEILDDMLWQEGNLPTGHRTTIRSGLPNGTWRKLNYGVQPEKSTTVQVTDSCGMLESYAEIDKSLADLNGNTAEFRASEDHPFLQGMSQTMASTLFYGDTDTDPEKFMGLTPRFDSLSAGNLANVINEGDSSNLTSIWLVNWGPNTVHGVFPKGSKAGLNMDDLGEVTLEDSANGKYQGYRTHYKWDAGLTVRDWRYVVRVANIDTGAIVSDAATGPNLPDLMVRALEQIESLQGRPVFYCNRTIRSFLRRQIRSVSNVNLEFDTVAGKRVAFFDEVPVRICDQIVNTETAVA